MKKKLRLLATCLAVGFSALFSSSLCAATTDVEVINNDYGSSTDYPFPLSWLQGASQTIYPASLLDAAITEDSYTIKELVYPLKTVPTSGSFNVSVYLAQTTATYLSSPLAESDFTLVSNNVQIDCTSITDGKLRIPVLTPFEMEHGKGLVVGMYVTAEEGSAPTPAIEVLQSMIEWDYDTHSISNYSKPTSVSFADAKWSNDEEYKVPSLILAYDTGGAPVSGGTSEVEVINNDNGSSTDYPFPLSWLQGASQTIYPASLLDAAITEDSYTIKELVYPLKTVPTSGSFNVSVYLAQTTATYLANPLAESDFTLVSNNVQIDCTSIADGKLRIPVLTPFEMEHGKGLVVGMYVTAEESSAPTPTIEVLQSMIEWDYDTHSISNYSKPTSVSFADAKWSNDEEYKVPSLILVYETAGGDEPAVENDLSATSITAPEGTIFAYKPYEFSVMVKNEGTQTVEGYTVAVINTEDNTVLGTTEVESPVYPNMAGRASVNVTFPGDGTYSIAARVTLVGDEVADNDLSEPIEVVVEKLPYKAVSLTGDAAPAIDTVATYTVKVANEGKTALEGYTVNLYMERELFADRLIATSENNPSIAVGAEADITFDYSFTLGGEYTLKAEVVKGDGEPSFTETLAVNVPVDGKLTPVVSEQVPTWDGVSHDFQGRALPHGDQFTRSASQILYPASYFGNHENTYQLQSIAFTVPTEEYVNDASSIKISMAKTNRTEGYTRGSVELIPAEDFTVVYEGTLERVQSKDESQLLKFDLQKLFELENGEGLALNVEVTMQEGSTPYYLDLATSNTGDEYFVAYRGTQAIDLESYSIYNASSPYVSNNLPCITFGYALVPLPAKMDVAGKAIEVTTEAPVAEQPVSFLVTFQNLGTVDVEEYTIELLDEKDNVLDTYEGTRYVAVGATASQSVKYTFAKEGSYKVCARLVVADDVDHFNDLTPYVTVQVAAGAPKVDVEATSISYSAQELRVDEPVSFVVAYKNIGETTLDNYSIQLIALNGQTETVLETYAGTSNVAPGASATQTIEYTFTAKNTYKLVARLVVADDIDEANNTTMPIEVVVDKDSGIDSVIAEGTMAYEAATSTLRVNVGEGMLAVYDMSGRVVTTYELKGAAALHLNLANGMYIISANGKTLKIRK